MHHVPEVPERQPPDAEDTQRLFEQQAGKGFRGEKADMNTYQRMHMAVPLNHQSSHERADER